MAASFPRDARILRFHPRAPQGYKGRRRDLLWPVLAYRVGVPVSPRAEQLDLFQRAVFGVLLHGINDPQQIADILNLHPDLVRIVKSFLVDRDLIDQDDIVKPDAERRYREARSDLGQRADGFTTGYVFQDPFSGLLLPRLVETLETADFTVQESGFPELHRGERVFRPYVEFLPAERPAPPHATDVMRAFEASRKAQKGRWETDDDEEGAQARFLNRVKRVNFIEREPEVMYLSTFIFGHGLSGWEVADPFGLPTSPLTALAHRRLTTSKHLRTFVQHLSEERGAADTQHDPFEEALASLQHEFGPQVDDHPLLQPLLDTELAVTEFRAAPGNQRPRRARQALGAIRALAEHLLREVRSRHSAAGAERQMIDRDALYNLRRIEAAADALSFTLPLPATLTSVKATDVYWMANREQSGKLRPLLVSLLLSAGARPDHPFHAAARSAPDFLQQFDEMLGWCGEAAHVGPAPAELESRVEPALERVYRATHLLLTASGPSPASPQATVRVAPEPQHLEFDDLEL
ncbi:hypothetical protein [Deinococcus arcticus]|uniref:Uncharacterized protein n=1 Tax=Deinococcus arcticus TaxID=2136176 RepID=A0A2T3W4U9_9DEIO|nr:hypothetical protein [Deinococcus arcticus]PTA66920.1 hypothetical protein C8263_15235 [Deinococcus arcticus]